MTALLGTLGGLLVGWFLGRRTLRKQAARLATFGLKSQPNWEDYDTRELIEAALSWQKRRNDPGGQDRRLDTALRNWRGRWNR